MKPNRRYELMLVAGLILLGVLLDRLQTRYRTSGASDPLTGSARTMVRPLAVGLTNLSNGVADFGSALMRGRALEAENRRLRERLADAENEKANTEDLRREIDDLRLLGDWKKRPGRQKTPAEVIGYFPDEHRISIDAGRDRAIQVGMPVVAAGGLLGRIETVDAHTSQVLLLTSGRDDARITALVRHKDSDGAGLLRGNGAHALQLELTDPTVAVSPGDRVTTSGFSRLIPRGISVGIVIRVEDEPAFGKRYAIIQPSVTAGQAREVLVIQ